MNRARGCLLAVLLGLLSVGPMPAGTAAAAPGGSSDDRATFGVRPSTAKGPDNRPTYAYAATPGSEVTDHVEVSNASGRPLTLAVYASDAFNPQSGGFDLLAAAREPVDVGAWVKLARNTVTVPARSTTIVSFTLRIPVDATPGDHAGGIVASMATAETDAQGDRVRVDQRVGARIYLRVTGALQPALTVEGLSAQFHPSLNPFGASRTTLTYRVRNTGNVRLGARQRVTVGALWGADREATGIVDLPEILPGNAVDVAAEVSGSLPAIWLTTRVRAEPITPSADQTLLVSAIARERGFWAVPWTLLALLALVATGVVTGWLNGRRRTRRAVAAAVGNRAAG